VNLRSALVWVAFGATALTISLAMAADKSCEAPLLPGTSAHFLRAIEHARTAFPSKIFSRPDFYFEQADRLLTYQNPFAVIPEEVAVLHDVLAEAAHPIGIYLDTMAPLRRARWINRQGEELTTVPPQSTAGGPVRSHLDWDALFRDLQRVFDGNLSLAGQVLYQGSLFRFMRHSAMRVLPGFRLHPDLQTPGGSPPMTRVLEWRSLTHSESQGSGGFPSDLTSGSTLSVILIDTGLEHPHLDQQGIQVLPPLEALEQKLVTLASKFKWIHASIDRSPAILAFLAPLRSLPELEFTEAPSFEDSNDVDIERLYESCRSSGPTSVTFAVPASAFSSWDTQAITRGDVLGLGCFPNLKTLRIRENHPYVANVFSSAESQNWWSGVAPGRNKSRAILSSVARALEITSLENVVIEIPAAFDDAKFHPYERLIKDLKKLSPRLGVRLEVR
jgi:hypothetical protein